MREAELFAAHGIRSGAWGGAWAEPLAPLVRFPDRAPIRMALHVPTTIAARAWLAWLRSRGWHTHLVGQAALAHSPDPAMPPWLVGFVIAGQAPAWLPFLGSPSRIPGRRGRLAVAAETRTPLEVVTRDR